MVTVSPATGADWIASSAAFLIASEVRVAPETVSQLLIVSSVAAWPSSFVLNPFVLEYLSILKILTLEFDFNKIICFFTVFVDSKMNQKYQKISECLHMSY